MDFQNALTLIISVLTLLVTYIVFKDNDTPKIIIYIEPNANKESFINLVIKNVGNAIAYDVTFNSDRRIPRGAFGLEKLNEPVRYFENGIFKHGVKVFNPKQQFVYEWGQYQGLLDALENRPILIEATYKHRFPLNLWKSDIKDSSIIDINELHGLASNPGSIIIELKNIGESLKKIAHKNKY